VGSGLAAPAWAADPSASQAPSSAKPHCVVTAVEVNRAAPVAGPRCFATFAEAVFEATDGRVSLPAGARELDQRTLDAANRVNATSATVIGIEYENKYFLGWSYVIQSTNSRGCAGYSYRVPTLPSNRDNEISSARTYSGCRSSHYSGTNFTGSRYLCGCSQMGTMNDQTSSIFFSATGYRAG
jgi:hypothetical protein